jgi:hypothetical protein
MLLAISMAFSGLGVDYFCIRCSKPPLSSAS